MLAMTSSGISSNQLPDHPNSYVVLLVENHAITTPSGQIASVLSMTSPHYSESGIGSGEAMLFFDPSDIIDDAGDGGGYRIVADIENSSTIPDEVLLMDVDGDKGGGSFEHVNWPVFLLFTIVMATIGGNVLVCLAVGYMRKLQNMFNYFLVSLALSDMLSAILIMPLSIVRSAVETFTIPKLVCVGWYSLDVLFTSSTIIHLCMISVDRFMTLTYPLRYGHAKKKKHTIVKIALVWIISFCIAGPLFVLSMWDQQVDSVEYKGCGPETPTFVISATVTSFYLPLAIMTVMYALTVRALQQQLREQRRMTVTNSGRSGSRAAGDCTPCDSGSLSRQASQRGAGGGGGPIGSIFQRSSRASCGSDATTVLDPERRRASTLAVPTSTTSTPRNAGCERIPLTRQRSSPASTVDTVVLQSNSTSSPLATVVDDGYGSTAMLQSQSGRTGTVTGRTMRSGSTVEVTTCRSRSNCTTGGGEPASIIGGRFLAVTDGWVDRRRTSFGLATGNCTSSLSVSRAGSDVMLRPPTPNYGGGGGSGDDDSDSVNQLNFTGSGSPPCSPGGGLGSSGSTSDGRFRFRYNRSFTFRRGTSTSSSGIGTGSRRSSNSPDKGRRAVQVLGILFAVFVACYLPFFAVYVIKSTCGPRCLPYLTPRLLFALEWLAYSGSALNPIIYHIFNPDFRRAFDSILRCRCRSFSGGSPGGSGNGGRRHGGLSFGRRLHSHRGQNNGVASANSSPAHRYRVASSVGLGRMHSKRDSTPVCRIDTV